MTETTELLPNPGDGAATPQPAAPLASRRRIPELDGLRGIAISLVLIYHYVISLTSPGTPWYNHWVHLALNATWSGVDLFFVLSGFLLGGILLDNREAGNVLRVFYARRTLRIFPLYFAFLSMVALLQTFWKSKPPEQFAHTLPLWTYFLYVQNIAMARAGHFGVNWLGLTWSLAVEEQFYLILPLLMLMLRGRALVLALIALVVASPLFRWRLYGQPGGAHAAYVLLPCRWDALFLGVLGAYLMRRGKFVDWMQKRMGLLYCAVAVLGVLVVRAGGRASVMGYSWLGLMYLCFVFIALLSPVAWIKGVLRLRWLRGLGIIAYGVYLFHETALGLCFYFAGYESIQVINWRTAWVMVGALCATILLAAVSFRYFEAPLIARGHRFKYARPMEGGVSV